MSMSQDFLQPPEAASIGLWRHHSNLYSSTSCRILS
jgi:hypothetical protein